MARRYLLDAVEGAINEHPRWTMSRDLAKAVNFKLKKNRWSKNIGPPRIGALARVLSEEGRIQRRRMVGYSQDEKNRWEYRPLFEAPRNFSAAFSLVFGI